MIRETPFEQARREQRERMARGEPEPGTAGCLRCGETAGVRVFAVPMDAAAFEAYRRGEGLLNELDSWMRDLNQPIQLVTVCPCCSFAGCPHPTWPDCPACGRPIAPEGKWATRCLADGNHAVVPV